jgi:hypothetical protein
MALDNTDVGHASSFGTYLAQGAGSEISQASPDLARHPKTENLATELNTGLRKAFFAGGRCNDPDDKSEVQRVGPRTPPSQPASRSPNASSQPAASALRIARALGPHPRAP